MANTKGNAYPLWTISPDYQVFAIQEDQTSVSKSNEDFAISLAISEDGTVWALSLSPDPDGGGAKLFWSNGDGQWNEINTPDPGGIQITGYTGSSCLYLTYDNELRSMNTNGTSQVLYNNSDNPLISVAYGGGMTWALRLETGGSIPVLSFSADNGKSWTAFDGNLSPFNLSVSYDGNCYGNNENYDPIFYSKDGSSSGSAGAGINGRTFNISFANWMYALTTDIKPEGNLVAVWEDEFGGKFEPMSIRASSIAASYYQRTV